MRFDKAFTIHSPSDFKEINIYEKKERSRSKVSKKDHYTSEFTSPFAVSCNKSRAMRHDKESESTSNKDIILTNKLRYTIKAKKAIKKEENDNYTIPFPMFII